MHAGSRNPAPRPRRPSPCCTRAAPICSCAGCVTLTQLAAITCLADAAPFNCCREPTDSIQPPFLRPSVPTDPVPDPTLEPVRDIDDFGSGGPVATPPGPFDGEDCCDDDSLCCCGGCFSPYDCSRITCIALPDDLPDDYRPCCGERPIPTYDEDGPAVGPEDEDEDEGPGLFPNGLPRPAVPTPPGPFDGEDCCDDDSLCCCGGCFTPYECSVMTCLALPEDLPDDHRPCCGDSDPMPDPMPEPGLGLGSGGPVATPPGPFDGEDCCDDDSLCCCGGCFSPYDCSRITCLALPDDLPDDYRPCCGERPIPTYDEDGPAVGPDDEDEGPGFFPNGLPRSPPPIPPGPFDGEDCCDDDSLCCCGRCRTPYDCSRITCIVLPDDLPDDYRPCCADPGTDAEGPAPVPAEDPDGPPELPSDPPLAAEIAECCTADAPACCCGGCATQEFCALVDCAPSAPLGCCGEDAMAP